MTKPVFQVRPGVLTDAAAWRDSRTNERRTSSGRSISSTGHGFAVSVSTIDVYERSERVFIRILLRDTSRSRAVRVPRPDDGRSV